MHAQALYRNRASALRQRLYKAVAYELLRADAHTSS